MLSVSLNKTFLSLSLVRVTVMVKVRVRTVLRVMVQLIQSVEWRGIGLRSELTLFSI